MTRKGRSGNVTRSAPAPTARNDYGLAVHPLSLADRAEVRAALLANAAETTDRFPEFQAELLDLLRRVFPVHLIAVVSQYGLSSPISSVSGISSRTFVPTILQHHVELLQAFALHLPITEWGELPASPLDIQKAIDLLPELCDAFHARRFLDAEKVKETEDRYRLMLREKIRLHTQMVRNWGHEAQVQEISRRLYAPLDETFRDALGFSLSDLIDVAKALGE